MTRNGKELEEIRLSGNRLGQGYLPFPSLFFFRWLPLTKWESFFYAKISLGGLDLHITFSLIANYLGLVIAVWLGWYVVTRSPRKLISWLTGITLWSIGGLFLNMVLALNPPTTPMNSPGWLRVLYPFWPREAFESGWVGWLQGWQVTPAVVLWHHVTTIMRPGKMNWWRWTRVISGYVVALIAIIIQIFTPLMFADIAGDPLYLNTLKPGPLYLPFLFLLLMYTGFSLINLSRSARATQEILPKQQFIILAIATLTAGLTAPIAFLAAIFELSLPRTSLTILLTIAMILIGYGIARYSSLMEGRTIRRDFIYNGVAMALITGIYSLVTWISVKIYSIPAAAFVFVIMLAIITHNLVDVTRRYLDSLFYRQENRQLRSNLRHLASLVGEKDLKDRVTIALEAICNSARATYGFVIIFRENKMDEIVVHRIDIDTIPSSIENLQIDDVTHIEPGFFDSPLSDASLLIPLYAEIKQVGVLALGRPINSTQYSNDDVERIIYPCDRLAEIIDTDQKENEYLSQLTQLTQRQKKQPSARHSSITVKDIEYALRNIFDYAQLGDSPLKGLNLVSRRIAVDEVTHLDQGKAVYKVISDAIEKLRPDTEIPRDPPPREWHPYLILQDAYMEGKLNRDIMSRLYISEGTFNRTRRSAIRAVARAIEEMEISQR